MNELMKKRTKALLIDTAISTAVSFAVEPLLKRKTKSSFVYTVVSPTVIFWGLEYAQMRLKGQTIGHRMMGIEVQNEAGGEPTPEQILERMVHRDTVSPFIYLKDRAQYDAYEGDRFPHDLYSYTVVKEVE
ncbi:RDD family protein [Microbacterium sp. APC 3898]|uniref:RDD family protein n=2 Tax=Planococcus TaxID=1372 RepID=A0ABT7ZJX4_9BACL|nr:MULTISPECIES: RDD family protein [Terrabacteria group]MBD8014566.1 RDD family protein [Planococcus wigleyi]MDN3427456.1 RDD family protein [Planococcus sp. APC 4016]MDN3436807.1 RDD family protein [Planococcus sp. APC 3900]MDN3499007.1 RDD family protein [Microbacterium sp. APC 3898]